MPQAGAYRCTRRGGRPKPVLATVLVGGDGERSRQRRKERYGCGLPLAGAHPPAVSYVQHLCYSFADLLFLSCQKN